MQNFTHREDIDFSSNPLVDIERLIGYRFSVSAERSVKAFEEFTMPDGEIVRLSHYVFGYVSEGRISDEAELQVMTKRLWEDIKLSWSPGTFLMWRKHPEITEYNDRDPGWFDRGQKGPLEGTPDNWITKITLRIGSVIPPCATPALVKEGQSISYFTK